eukprot:scaffold13021_cov73-Skeletonema_dohrnii-CCMP3373.AAC.2
MLSGGRSKSTERRVMLARKLRKCFRLLSKHDRNTLKGGGASITKLIDSCRERIGIRGEGTVACARILIHRFTFADSIDLFIDLILKHAGIGSGADDGRAIDLSGLQDDLPSGVFAPSLSGAVTTVDQSNDNETEDKSKVMPYATVKSNTTPGQGQDVYVPSQWFEERSKTCDGVYWGKRLKRLENSRWTQTETSTCHVCKRDTAWHCFGCNRYLCNIPPQQKNDSGRTKAKGNGGKKNAKANETRKAIGKTTTTTKKKSSAKKSKGKGKKQSGDDKDDDGKKREGIEQREVC